MSNTTIEPTSTVTRNPEVRVRRIQGQLTLIHEAQTYQLNETAERAWAVCDGETVAEIAREVAEEFDVDQTTAEQDLIDVFEQLATLGAVRVG